VRVLVVEDEPLLMRQLQAALADAGYAVDCAADGERAEFLGRTEQYAAVVLDLGLPKLDGLSVLRQWREAGIAVPVLVLTARGSWHDKVRGIDGGADDYVAKPFRIEEVLARLRALIRRGRLPLTPAVISIGDLRLDLRARQVYRRDHIVRLTSREFALLEFLVLHAGEVVGRGAIAEHVWDSPFESMSNVIDVMIQRLRRKIDDPRRASIITTRRGEGYMLARVADPSHDP
jgi:two-component system OmpR family response regulator